MSSSVGYSSSGGKRSRTAYAQAMAAKQRRQLIIVISLAVVLIGVLAWEIPHVLGGKKTPAVVAAPPVPVAVPPASAKDQLKALLKTAPADPFSAPAAGSAGTVRDVPIPAGSRDPFAVAAPVVGTPQAPAVTSPLPEQIVIGTPGGSRVASHGWIVILASIPTGEGETTATSFAAKARHGGIDSVAVLNSSNRRPLRGGYWVVYTGPYTSLSAVSQRATAVHSQGYPTAYIRELIVYK
jgi:hypothetical protein